MANDLVVEGTEQFVLNLSNPSNGATIADSQGIATVTDVDQPPVHLIGTPGNDSYTALSGNERIDALGGIDTITFDFRLVDATVSYVGNQVIIDGPSSHTVLTGFERYVFTDGTVEQQRRQLADRRLYYYSQYHDVWNAHVDADAHYNSTAGTNSAIRTRSSPPASISRSIRT